MPVTGTPESLRAFAAREAAISRWHADGAITRAEYLALARAASTGDTGDAERMGLDGAPRSLGFA